ncbi:hypothetical protein QNR99_004686 [Escherichia coli]|nr:hypothetical protein [Escherichia coli]
MCNNTRPDAAAEAIKTQIDALIDISVIADRAHKHATSETEYAGAFVPHSLIADRAHKHATSETEYAGAFVPHSLAVMQLSADMALNEASKIIMADMEVVSHE